eukprot:CAMPEP_0184358016 /NCGR_PEP_ID=MMETSP1089-20130417/112238_1 /TAXON_ID=38269 ORGANISM="Gloeochaete wittrockiana, Strain SAG46.84" /NCGR_SAMPLE_ID=MMETSP1089 /ASSEMBLY_ACC=CAM_ASM_000445 /LENGTH=31 /DNA_ID= /DNA_START= /DNA_END= /DNA_ORIENTATION=
MAANETPEKAVARRARRATDMPRAAALQELH